MNARLLALLLFAPFTAAPLGAQLSEPGSPASFGAHLEGEVPVHVLAAPDLERARREDEELARTNEVRPYRFGLVVETAIGIETDGLWSEVPDTGALVWRASVSSPGAFSLGLLFAEYDLPIGARVFVYSPDRSRVLGAYTEANEQANGMLAIQPLPGDTLVIEYVHPDDVGNAGNAAEAPRLALASVVHDYRDFFAHASGLAVERAASCLVDINCPAGAPYQDIKRASIGISTGGIWCSGSILNNTGEDGTPYMLTAEHCGNYTNGTFFFNYDKPKCGTGQAPTSQTLSGSVRLASDARVDSQLYRLNNAPPPSFAPFYAGWSRSGSPPAPTISISHPSAKPKKICIDNDEPALNNSMFFHVRWDLGEIQGGSSGSPLFEGNKRVIGPLCCGLGSCDQQAVDYGRFGRFFSRNSLAQYLDPVGTGSIGIDGFDPFAPSANAYNGSGVNPNVYTSSLPALGAVWTANIDTSAYPSATTTTIVGFSAPQSQLFGFGELLVGGPGSAFLLQSTAPVAGGVSSHSNAIPNDPTLAGKKAYTQAFLLGGPTQATNGIVLRVF
jgi:hypothetical protein